MVDFTKIDFAKFDPAKLFDVDAAIAKMEEGSTAATALITDKKARTLVETMTAASFELVRAQAAATKTYAEAVRKAVQI